MKMQTEMLTVQLGQFGNKTIGQEYDENVLFAEFKKLVQYLASGGQAGVHGPINKVVGIHVGVMVNMVVDAPEETWAKFKIGEPTKEDVPHGTHKNNKKGNPN